MRPLETAEWTSAQICAVRRSSATSAVNTAWMSARLVLAHLGAGLVNDELSAHELGSGDRAGLDLVADRSAVEPDDRFELVPPVRGGGEAEPSAGPGPLDARRERDGGKVVALVDDDEPVPVEDRSRSSRRARLWSIATSTTPVGLSLPPPIWPICFGSKTEVLGES